MAELWARWMGLGGQPEVKAADVTTSAELAAAIIRGSESVYGQSITSETAMRAATVYSCVSIIAGTVGSTPLVLRRTIRRNGRDYHSPATDSDLHERLHRRPNERQTAFSFWETALVHLLLRGNFFARKRLGFGRRLVALDPIHPDTVSVDKLRDGTLRYDISGEESRLTRRHVFHIVGLSSNGWMGRSVIADHRETIGEQLGRTDHQNRFLAQGANYGASLTLPPGTPYGSKGHKRIREELTEKYENPEYAGKTFLLEHGMEIDKLSMTHADAQWVENSNMTRADLAAIFHVPGFLVGLKETSQWGRGIEEQKEGFIDFTIRGLWCKRIEQEIDSQLVSEPNISSKFNLDALLRGNPLKRTNVLAKRHASGMNTMNEIRAINGDNPIEEPWADRFYIQANNLLPAGEVTREEGQTEEQEP